LVKTRAELLASIRPSFRQYLRRDTGDVPVARTPVPATGEEQESRVAASLPMVL